MQDSYAFYTDKLKGEYKETFEKIQVYQGTFRMDNDTYEERMMEILDIFLHAQEEGKPVERITGKNLEWFCRRFCRGAGWKSVLIDLAEGARFMMWAFLLDALLLFPDVWGLMVKGDFAAAWKLPLDFSVMTVVWGFLLVYGISEVFHVIERGVMFRLKKFSFRLYIGIEIGMMVVLGVILFLAFNGDEEWWEMFLNNRISAMATALVSGIYLILYYFLTRERRRERKEHKISFWDMVKEQTEDVDSIDHTMDKTFHKRFEKKNRRLRRWKKEELSWNEFVDKIEREDALLQRGNWLFYYALPYGIAIGSTITMYQTNSFETTWDMFFYFVLMMVVETLVMIPFRKLDKIGHESRRTWIEAQRSVDKSA